MDILFWLKPLINGGQDSFQAGDESTRSSFSYEHMVVWKEWRCIVTPSQTDNKYLLGHHLLSEWQMTCVRLRHPKGVSTLELPQDGPTLTVWDFQQQICLISEILPSRQTGKSVPVNIVMPLIALHCSQNRLSTEISDIDSWTPLFKPWDYSRRSNYCERNSGIRSGWRSCAGYYDSTTPTPWFGGGNAHQFHPIVERCW